MFLTTVAIATPVLEVTAEAVQAIVPMTPPAKGIAGVDEAVKTFLGWALYIVSILSLIALLVIGYQGFKVYRHNQGENLMERVQTWIIAALIGAYAKDLVGIFIPGFSAEVVAIPIPGMDGPVREILGNIVWVIQIVAFLAVLALAGMGFLAWKDDRAGSFVEKAFAWIVAALIVSLASNIAGFFFPAVLTFG